MSSSKRRENSTRQMFYAHEVQNLLRACNFRTPARPAGFENFRLWSIGGSSRLLAGSRLAVDYARGGREFSEEAYDLSLRYDLLNLGYGRSDQQAFAEPDDPRGNGGGHNTSLRNPATHRLGQYPRRRCLPALRRGLFHRD